MLRKTESAGLLWRSADSEAINVIDRTAENMPVVGVASARASHVRLPLDGGSPESSGIQACGRARFRAGRRARSLELRLQFEAPHTTIPPSPRSVHVEHHD